MQIFGSLGHLFKLSHPKRKVCVQERKKLDQLVETYNPIQKSLNYLLWRNFELNFAVKTIQLSACLKMK